jgi:farnesyl-diphosphate farnesyltransferase
MSPVSAERLDDLLVKTSRTFAISIPELPEPTRREVTIAYLLFRIADTLEDATAWSASRKLEALRRFDTLLSEPTPESARQLAAAWVAEPPIDHVGYQELLGETPAVLTAYGELDPAARELIATHTRRTIERMIAFVGRPDEGARLELSDVEDLRAYCYAVAGIVGEMLTELFLLRWTELEPIAAELRLRAPRFGEALQLVNILKDSAWDESEGRSYLAGVERGEVLALARKDLLEAGRYVMALQKAGAPIGLVAFTSLPVLLARETLDRVETDGPGAKLTRPEVREIIAKLERAIRHGDSPVF